MKKSKNSTSSKRANKSFYNIIVKDMEGVVIVHTSTESLMGDLSRERKSLKSAVEKKKWKSDGFNYLHLTAARCFSMNYLIKYLLKANHEV